MADVYCPACKAVYPEGTADCWRCRRPGTPALRTQRHSSLLPLDPAQPLDVASPEPTSDQERERPGAPFEGRDVSRHAPPDELDEDI
jgi:hypothetical protein